jgi:hypothetical protein
MIYLSILIILILFDIIEVKKSNKLYHRDMILIKYVKSKLKL